MLAGAQAWLRQAAPGTPLVQADATALPFRRVFDLAFSAATFHWVRDHGALFRSIITVLRPGGRLVAQCGGGPNLAVLLARADGLMRGRFAPFFEGWTPPWYFADVDTTRRRLAAAGFVDVEVWLEEAPTRFSGPSDFAEFVATVCVRHHLDRLPHADRADFVQALTLAAATDPDPFMLDYWRLNISARRPQ
jgi:trans-aconitate 2-methyltransferase